MASERAKELAAEQKAAKNAEKLRRKNSTDPKDWGQVRQIIEVYKVTTEHDPKANLFMGGALGFTGRLGAAVFLHRQNMASLPHWPQG